MFFNHKSPTRTKPTHRKCNEYQSKLCVGYIEYEKAFDSVEQSDLFTALRIIGVSEGYVHIMKDIYTNATHLCF